MDRSSRGALLVYGATGYIGRLTTSAALARGLRPCAAGRNRERLASLAAELGLDGYRAAALDDAVGLDRCLRDVTVLINAAGPFSHTWEPLVDACLRRGVHYLDLAGEVRVFEGIAARSAEARRHGILLLPGVGFDVVPSDCLAAHVAGLLPGADSLRIAISGLELVSGGSARTLAEQVGSPTLVRRNGRLTSIATGSLERSFDFGAGASPSVAVTWGDLSTAFVSTGIANIETYFEATPAVRATGSMHRWFGPMLSTPFCQSALQTLTTFLPDGPDAAVRTARSATIVAEAEHRSGRVVRARLRTPEAYTFSAITAAAIAARVVAGDFAPGFQTPARLYGPNYVLRFEGVQREALPA
jgi:short subunit dehydrogenase-like uncharacterized protein